MGALLNAFVAGMCTTAALHSYGAGDATAGIIQTVLAVGNAIFAVVLGWHAIAKARNQ